QPCAASCSDKGYPVVTEVNETAAPNAGIKTDIVYNPRLATVSSIIQKSEKVTGAKESSFDVAETAISSLLSGSNTGFLKAGASLQVWLIQSEGGWEAQAPDLDIVVFDTTPERALVQLGDTILELHEVYTTDDQSVTADARELAEKLKRLLG
ncbi:MAG: hypothetical protein ACOCWU_06630, partial [Spirochaetota bacterium]